MKHLILFCVALVLFTACNDEKKQVTALQKETESIHDAAMKEMADMNRVARDIKQFMISATLTPEQNETYTSTLKAIGDAENDMMAWMANYKEPSDKPAAEALTYLKEQKALIEKNQATIKAATEAGKKLLAK